LAVSWKRWARILLFLFLLPIQKNRDSGFPRQQQEAGHSPVIWTFILVGIHVLIGTLWSVALIMSMHFASGILKRPRVISGMDRATGGLFLCFAAKLAFSSR